MRPLLTRLFVATTTILILSPLGANSLAYAQPVPNTSNVSHCKSAKTQVLASQLGSLENLAFDNKGLMIVSKHNLLTGIGSLLTFNKNRTIRPLIRSIPNPGGIVVNGGSVSITTADTFISAIANTPNGTIAHVNLKTGAHSTVASGLIMPNGLAILPNGTAITSRITGVRTGLFASTPGSTSPKPYALQGISVNGITLDKTGRWLYTISSIAQTTTVYKIDTKNPKAAIKRTKIPGIGLLNFGDDLTVASDGTIYAALNLQGLIARINPITGSSCLISTNQPGLSSVRFGSGPGWDSRSLYGTTLLGSIIKISAL